MSTYSPTIPSRATYGSHALKAITSMGTSSQTYGAPIADALVAIGKRLRNDVPADARNEVKSWLRSAEGYAHDRELQRAIGD